jgi:hypothetical protein
MADAIRVDRVAPMMQNASASIVKTPLTSAAKHRSMDQR